VSVRVQKMVVCDVKIENDHCKGRVKFKCEKMTPSKKERINRNVVGMPGRHAK